MKWVEKYDASPKGTRWKFLDMLIDHRNLLWNINFPKFPWLFYNFPDFQQISKFPRQILKFPDFSLTLNFPDFSLTSGNPRPATVPTWLIDLVKLGYSFNVHAWLLLCVALWIGIMKNPV